MHLACSVRTAGDVTFVRLRATNDASDPHRVRIADRLDGPVWVPRRDGRRDPGWDERGYAAVFGAGETRALGYASPSPPADPPAAVVVDDPVSPRVDTGGSARSDAAAVIRRLGDPRPPRDGVPRRATRAADRSLADEPPQ